jgi:hypothetical protein
MTEVAAANINTFGPSPKADFVSPSEQLITLTYGQLVQAIQEAIQPLQDRIESLEDTLASQHGEITNLRESVASWRKTGILSLITNSSSSGLSKI